MCYKQISGRINGKAIRGLSIVHRKCGSGLSFIDRSLGRAKAKEL